MEVIEGCDGAKDFSIKAPLFKDPQGKAIYWQKPGDQSWKTQLSNSSIIGRRFKAPVQASMHVSFLCFCLNQHHIRTRTRALTHPQAGEQSRTLQRSKEIHLTPGYRGAPVMGE